MKTTVHRRWQLWCETSVSKKGTGGERTTKSRGKKLNHEPNVRTMYVGPRSRSFCFRLGDCRDGGGVHPDKGAGRCVEHNDSGPSHFLNLIHNAADAATRRTFHAYIVEHGTQCMAHRAWHRDQLESRRVAPPHDHASVISALLDSHPAAGCVTLAQMQDGTFPARIRVWLAQVLAAYVLN